MIQAAGPGGTMKSSLHELGMRLRAARWHIVASALVGGLCALLVLYLWFPWPFAELAGGRRLIALLLVVNMAVGPMLTVIVASPGKQPQTFFRDLAVIVCVQVLALSYGLITVVQSRPVYLVFEVDRLSLVAAADVDPADLRGATESFRRLPLWGVTLIGLRPVGTTDALHSVQLALAGKDLALRPALWELLSQRHLQQMRLRSVPLSRLQAVVPPEWADTLSALVSSSSDLVALPVVGRWNTWTAVLDGRTGQILAYLPIDPF